MHSTAPQRDASVAPHDDRRRLRLAAKRALRGTSVSLVVIDAGLEARVVDAGRPRSRRLGVPIGGAADRAALALANALVGNPRAAAGIEIAVKGPIVRAEADIACAVVGAPFAMSIGTRTLSANGVFQLRAGQELVISGAPTGMRAYLCAPGGFSAPEVLGSRSGLAPLAVGDRLACAASQAFPRNLSPECPFLTFPKEWRLRASTGPQADWFQTNGFFGQTYRVGRAGNRMGLRLEGDPLPLEREMVSEPVCPGCVQITREGQPIILGVDGQTIGGYPKIAVVCDADLDLLGQIRPGDRVRFEAVDLDQALAAGRERERALHEWLTRIRIFVDASPAAS
jgi:biotin-dependent carboxylase-like uncharacterized protein